MCNFCDKHEVLALQVCVLCNLDIELVVETMFTAVEIDTHIDGVNSSSMLMGLHSAMMCKTNIFLIYTG